MYKTKAAGLPMEAGLIKIQQLRKRLIKLDFDLLFWLWWIDFLNIGHQKSFKTEEIFELIPQYAKIADKPSGLCYMDKFAHKIGLALNERLIRLFEMFDKVKIWQLLNILRFGIEFFMLKGKMWTFYNDKLCRNLFWIGQISFGEWQKARICHKYFKCNQQKKLVVLKLANFEFLIILCRG